MPFAYEHAALPREIQTISGYYRLQEEKLLEHESGLVLYLTGFGVVDNSCCGTGGGCAYALVQGWVLEYRGWKDGQGREVSRLLAIEDQERRQEVRQQIHQREQVQQVVFHEQGGACTN